ncbi:helix-turn-helix domain-containing protein [Gemmatimonas sp.]|uniref:helix-turn-helix domain-containing protein n=1 Tax=Gemmatimonas sp. TaxID=1962908 RepID=UPI003DA630D4
MRLRIPELLDAMPGGWSAERLHKEAGTDAKGDARLSRSTCYRLVQKQGRVKCFDADVLDVLCDVLGVKPSELLERETAPPTRAKKATKTPAKRGTRKT